jgi:photosystem II stability/assembly factor-like uncharacterized protein
MSDDFDIEDVLRASLAERARKAPDGNQLAERIIAEADHPGWVHEPRGPRQWRGWMLPAVAAASVIAVVATIVGLVQLKHSDKDAADADHRALTSGRSSAPPATLSGSVYGTAVPSASEPSPSAGKLGGQVPDKFRVFDLTFVDQHAWALGQGDCLDGTPGVCDAVLRSDDDGANWSSTPNPPAPVTPTCDDPAADPCVSHLRFASNTVGYAFGANSLYMTTDGGLNWDPENQGPTSSLEVANGTALRVSGSQLLTATVGSPTWKAATLPAKAAVSGPIVRAFSNAYVPAGSSNGFYASSDNGTHWTPRSSPCSNGGEITSMSAGSDGSLAVMCLPSTTSPAQLFVSDNGGKSFDRQVARVTDANASSPFALVDASTVVCSSDGQLERTTDGGKQWTPVAIDKTVVTDAPVSGFLGFESSTTGRWVSGNGSTIYTTTDSGQKWTPYTFK